MPKKSQSYLSVALVGASGRMGQEIQRLAQQERCKIVAAVETKKDWANVKEAKPDVVVDFSTPAGLLEAIAWCSRNRIPLVSGTTGIGPKQRAAFKKAAKTIPIFYSSNMSQGIATTQTMLEQLATVKEWDFQVEEIHHCHKKDRPSGTALLLQQALVKAIGRTAPEILSIRGGGVPGTHSVLAMGPDETILIQHIAYNRGVFARGALKAARWLFDKTRPGFYDLGHLYKTK